MKISVIIVTYNSQSIIEKCIDNLFLFNDIGDNLEVIIVDNSSESINLQMFNSLNNRYPNKLKLVKNDKNGGYGQGNNIGIDYANGEVVAIMNPDVILTDFLFKDAQNHFFKNDNLAMMGFKQRGGNNLSFYCRLEFYIPFISGYIVKFFNKINLFNKHIMFLSGAFLFVDKKHFHDIGFFDENIFLYAEESDITKRFLFRGFDIIYDGSRSYLHEIDERNDMSSFSFDVFIKSVLYYLDKFSFSKYFFLVSIRFELVTKKIVYTLKNDKVRLIQLKDHLKIVKGYFKKSNRKL